MTPQEAAKRIIVALDSTDPAAIVGFARQLGPHVGMVKIGLEAFTALGPAIVAEVHREKCSVFLDLKFKDIPNTVAGAVRAATTLGVAAMNVHAGAGEEALRAAVKARDDVWETHPMNTTHPKPLLLAVTVLTSLSHHDLVRTGSAAAVGKNFLGSGDMVAEAIADAQDKAMKDIVTKRALLAKECGFEGCISSPVEIEMVRKACGAGFLIVTPGVRPTWAAANDQKRALTPAQAVKAGADYLVIGRPILKPPMSIDSAQTAASLIVKEICSTTEGA